MGSEMEANALKNDVKKKKQRILKEGDLMKAVIRSGQDSGTPKDGDLVIFHCATCTEDGSIVHSTRPEHGGSGNPLRLVLGKSKMIIGWEEALPTMTKGEVARFKVKPALHYGDPECPVPVLENVPTNGDLLFDFEMIDFFNVKVVTDDLAVLKQVVKDGVGWETPREPYEVLVRIVGRVAGCGESFLDRREEPLHFTFGKNEVPDGLERGIGTMTKGEEATLHISPPYITECSAIPDLPTKAPVIQFEVEVLQVIQVRDMLGNGCLIKRRVRDGKGEFPVDCPLHDSTLRIHYKVMLQKEADNVFYDTRRDCPGGEHLEFQSGEGMVPEGLEMSIRLMLPGEIAIVNSTAEYAYDKFPRPALFPEGAAVRWEVELLSFDARKDWTGFTFREIMIDAEKQKGTGNRLFKEGKFELAKAKYEFVLREFKHVNPDGDQETGELSQAQISLQLNVAACYQKLGDYLKSIETCNKVLEGNPYHVKALYRRGLAFVATADFEEARNDFNLMIVLDKSSEPDASAALAKLKKKEQEADLKARKQFGGLFDRKPGLLSHSEEKMSEEVSADPQILEKEGKIDEDKHEPSDDDNDDKIPPSDDDNDETNPPGEEDPFAGSRHLRHAQGYTNFLRTGFSNIRKATLGRCSIL